MSLSASATITPAAAAAPSSFGEGSLREAVAVWQGIRLSEVQKELDHQGQEIVNNQREAQASRKLLAEQTKDFKKATSSSAATAANAAAATAAVEDERAIAAGFKTLLKNYQTEIDNLTKRSKYAETAFLNLYKLLADAPDPAKMLESCLAQNEKLQQVEVLMTENKRLREEIDSSNKEFVDLTTKAGAASRLKEKVVEMENKMEAMVQEKVKDRENFLKEEFNNKLKVYKEREYDLERQLSRMKDQVEALQSNHDSTQATIFAHSMKFDEAVSAKLAELEIVMNDLERANERIAVCEREKELLKSQLESPQGAKQIEEQLTKVIRKLEESLNQKTNENLALMEELNSQKSKSVTKQVTHNSLIADLEEKLAEMQEEQERLKEKLAACVDYDEVKKELEILKFMEFPSEIETTNDGAAKSRDKNAPRFGESMTLEQLLVTKNKKLQSDITALKVRLDDVAKQLASSIEREEVSRGIIEEQRSLITKLEEDICVVNEATKAPEGTPNVDSPSKGDSLLPILTSQRDRYRKRNKELEEHVSQLQQQLQEINQKVEILTNDNVKLYENIRYLQSYREDQTQRAQASLTTDVTTKYRSAYEDKVNPFAAFHEREKAQRYNTLSVPEKVTMNIARALISHKYGRIFASCYLLFLHMFVLFIIYRMSLTAECVHDHDVVEGALSQ